MNKTLKLPVLLLGFIVMLGTSCKKYDEGPSFSLRTKKARLVNTWVLEKVESEDPNMQVTSDTKEMEIKKDGTGTYTDKDGKVGKFKWNLSKDGKHIMTSPIEDEEIAIVEEIVKLKNKELCTKMGKIKTYYKQK